MVYKSCMTSNQDRCVCVFVHVCVSVVVCVLESRAILYSCTMSEIYTGKKKRGKNNNTQWIFFCWEGRGEIDTSIMFE